MERTNKMVLRGDLAKTEEALYNGCMGIPSSRGEHRHRRRFFQSVLIFSRLDEAALDEVIAAFHVRVYPREGILFLEREEAARFYIVAAGQVRLFRTSSQGREFTLALARARHFFDIPPLFDNKPHVISAQALTTVRVYAIARDAMQQIMGRYASVERGLAYAMAQRLRRVADTASDLAFSDISTRLARLLVVSARNDGRPTPQGVVLEWELSQSEIAHLLGTAREVVSRHLKTLEKAGVVERTTRKGILIRDWQRLEEIAKL